jgi:hypothetical protein
MEIFMLQKTNLLRIAILLCGVKTMREEVQLNQERSLQPT